MSDKPKFNRQRTGMMLSGVTLFAGITGFVYQFMPDGTFLTFLVCMVALLGMVNNSKDLDERDNQLLAQSYSSAFTYLFFAVLLAYLFQLFFAKMQFATPIIATINTHWAGIMASIMCIFIGLAGIRSFRELKEQ